MKAAVQYGPKDVRVEDVPEPRCGSGEVKVKIEYCGVCGTDLEIYEGVFGLMFTEGWPKGPKIEGHEAAGTIVEVGPDTRQGYQVGQKVAMNFRSPCGACDYCRDGREHFCEHVTMSGGAFAEYAIYAESAIHLLPAGVSTRTGAMLEPLTVAMHVTDQAAIRRGATVAVSGAGTIGLLCLMLAVRSGASTVLVSEPVEAKRRLAEQLGATMTVDPLNEDIGAVAREATAGRGFDSVIEMSGNLRAARTALTLADKCGTIVLAGVYPHQETIPLSPFDLYASELTIKSAMVSPYLFPRSVNLLSRLDVEPLISATYPLEGIVDAFENHRNGIAIKTLIQPGTA
ncbi:MAG: zinc-dependent alcohol dehydrogenase [Thermoleophilia bacterium]